MATINSAILKKQVAEGYSAKAMKDAAQGRIEAIFDNEVKIMQEEFEEHPVTREIAGGIGSSNISETLGGGSSPKNLFAFIGFPEGEQDPTQPIREALSPDSNEGPKMTYIGKDAANPLIYRFQIDAPKLDAIYKDTPLPWGPGLSWAKKIETSIPGFAKFLPSFNSKSSRSGGGIQVQNSLRAESYTPPANGYLTTIFKNFINRLKGSNKGGYRITK